MSLSRTKLAGWGLGEVLTSAQVTAIDANIDNALDKRSGQTDTLGSLVSQAAGGRLVWLVQAGADADGTYQIANGQCIRVAPVTLTAARTYTLSTVGAVDGDILSIEVETPQAYYITVDNGGAGGGTLAVVGAGGHYHHSFRFNGTDWALVTYAHSGLYVDILTGSGNWTRPSWVTRVLLIGCGGGGGGGAGTPLSAGSVMSGGAGGGAAIVRTAYAVVSGATVAYACGTGGTGGVPVSGASGGNGQDGGDSTFGTVTFRGGQGGTGGNLTSDPLYSRGGGAVRTGYSLTAGNIIEYFNLPPGHGGWASTSTSFNTANPALRQGGSSSSAVGGPAGADIASKGGGGGGGSNDFTITNGAAGGAAAAAFPGTAGTAGTTGGGGGGGGGVNVFGAGLAGAGGNGGNGQIFVIYSR